MSWVAVAIGGAAVVGAVSSNQASKRATGAANDATNASINQSNAAVAESRRQYDLSRADYQPYLQAGTGALGKLQALYGIGGGGQFDSGAYLAANPDVAADPYWSQHAQEHYAAYGKNEGRSPTFTPTTGGTPDLSGFTTGPDYQFNLAEGQKAIDRSLSARGKALSGQGVKEGVRYASGMASGEFGNYVNRLSAMAGIGQSATGAVTTAGQNYSGAVMTGAQNNSTALMNAGNARASAYLQNGQTTGNTVNGLASNFLLMKYLNGGKG
jgi:hypothetical protein